jgi:hypothetical protein
MEMQRLGFIRRMPEKIMFFSMTAYMLLCLTGTASAINQTSIDIEAGQSDVVDAIDPGFILRPPAINIDPKFILPWAENDVDPDFSIPTESEEITVVPFTDESAVTSDSSPVQVPIDEVILIPEP